MYKFLLELILHIFLQCRLHHTLDIEATRKHYEEIDKYLTEAATGGAKIKPYHLYLHLIEERDRLKKILDDIDQK